MTDKEILNAAFRVWSDSFYQSTSLACLAETLEVTKPALYRHFKNKEALLEAMYRSCYDMAAEALKPDYEACFKIKDDTEKKMTLARSVAAYFLQNREVFIFWIAQIHGNQFKFDDSLEKLRARGVDLRLLLSAKGGGGRNFKLPSATIFFMIIYFYRNNLDARTPPKSEVLSIYLDSIISKIRYGLNLSRTSIDGIDFERLEKAAEACPLSPSGGDEAAEKIFKGVAEIVAESGLQFSMSSVANRLGLSKSSLYSHFENKAQMIREYFIREIKGICAHVITCTRLSAVPEEQLYLAIAGIFFYFRTNQNVLKTIDQLRIYKSKIKDEMTRLQEVKPVVTVQSIFSEIKKPDGTLFLNVRDTEWILFLIVNSLLPFPGEAKCTDMTKEELRHLFKFIAGGVEI